MPEASASDINQLRHQLTSAEHDNRELEARLKATEAKMERFVRAVEKGPVIVFITDHEGKITYVNPKFTLVTGYTKQEVLGKSPSILKSGETPDEVYKELWQTIQQGGTWTGIFHNRKKNGGTYWERATISPVVDERKKITHYVAIKEDITALREAESKVEKERLVNFHQSKMAEIGLLTASILHEVGNPIAAIRGMVGNLLDNARIDAEDGNQMQQSVIDSLKLISEHTDRLIGITHDIADLTTPQVDDHKLFDLNAIVRSTCKLIKFDRRLRNTRITLELDSQISAMDGFKDQLTHLILNLVINAADAVHEPNIDSPCISIATHGADDHVVLSIGDNGCGMSEEVRQNAFEPFYTTKSPMGTGLGLSLCHAIVTAHNGKIEIHPRPTGGTEVRVTLPQNCTQIIDWMQ